MKKPGVELTAESCDLLERSGLVDPLPCIPADVRAVILNSARLLPNPPGGLTSFRGIKGSGRDEYIRLVARQLHSQKVDALKRSRDVATPKNTRRLAAPTQLLSVSLF